MKKGFNRITGFLVIISLVFSIIISRLVYIQLVNGEYYAAMAQSMGEKPKSEIALRGELLDRNLKKLATNNDAYSIIYSSPKTKITDEQINASVVKALEIIFKNDDKSKIATGTMPIEFDADTGKYTYRATSEYKYDIFKFARSVKKPYKFVTSFDTAFDYSILEDFQKKLDSIKEDESKSTDDEVTNFENVHLANFDPERDARETFFRFAEKYKLIAYEDNGIQNNIYNLDSERLYGAVSIRYSLQSSEYKQYQDVEVAKNVRKETALEIRSKIEQMAGISAQVVPIRSYPNGEIGSAFLGYIGKISDEKKYGNLGYDLSRELVGKQGLEAVLENRENNDLGIQLRGEPGITYVKVDKLGRIIEETAKIEPVSGDTVVTTIDFYLQEVAEKSLEDVMAGIRSGKYSSKGEKFPAYRGAVVVMDIHTGEILALASKPGFNPNDFAETGSPMDRLLLEKYQLTPELVKRVDEDSRTTNIIPIRMYNYATRGTAPPGSIFKPFTALVGLEEGVITENRRIYDKTEYPTSGKPVKCWIHGRGSHGNVNVTEALKFSCNYFFNTVGDELGNERLAEWERKFGIVRDEFGKAAKTGIEILESSGLIGTPEELKNRAANKTMGNIINTLKTVRYGEYTIKSGTTEYNEIFKMILNEECNESRLGELGITNQDAKKYISGIIKPIDISAQSSDEAIYSAMGQGMVTLTPIEMAQLISTIVNGGTRYKAHLVKQVLYPDSTIKEIEPEILNKLDLDPHNVDIVKEGMGLVTDGEGGTGRDIFGDYPIPTGGKTGTAEIGFDNPQRASYAWYAGFAPLDKPEIAVVAVIYDGGHGSNAGYVARDIFNQYFKDNSGLQSWLARKNKGSK